MLFLKNNSDTLLIIVHEIYGINNHIQYVCTDLFQKGFDVICPNLLKDIDPFDYKNQHKAYNYFINNIGFDTSKNTIKTLLKTFRGYYKYQIVIGYSVGATTAWLCSDEEHYCDGIIGYYGSRIRDYMELTPKCPCLLFFPEEEISLNVNTLVNALNNKNKIIAYKMLGKHGFCDAYSNKYCNESYLKSNKLMLDFINNIQLLN